MMRHNAAMHPSCLQELTSAKKTSRETDFFVHFVFFVDYSCSFLSSALHVYYY